MKKQFYIPPRISFYEVETTAILAGSGGSSQKPVGSPKSFSVNEDVTCGDADEVWEYLIVRTTRDEKIIVFFVGRDYSHSLQQRRNYRKHR